MKKRYPEVDKALHRETLTDLMCGLRRSTASSMPSGNIIPELVFWRRGLDSQTRPPPKDSIWKAIRAVQLVLPMPTILLLATIQPIYVNGIPDRRPAWMRDLPIEEVDGEISRKWTERYHNVDDQDGRPLSLASKVNLTTSTFLMSLI